MRQRLTWRWSGHDPISLVFGNLRIAVGVLKILLAREARSSLTLEQLELAEEDAVI